jgi:diguanylate cyclase (GGDEF)-like protein
VQATTHDAMTGLANRAGFSAAAARLMRRGSRAWFAVAADCNQFKAVNDTFGHATGDAVLKALAARMRRLTSGAGIAARFGGDEFALICTAEQLAAIGGGVLAVAVLAEDGTTAAECTMAAGAARLDPATPLGTVLGRADAAAYRAKSTGVPLALFDPAADDHPATSAGERPRVRVRDLDHWDGAAAMASGAVEVA